MKLNSLFVTIVAVLFVGCGTLRQNPQYLSINKERDLKLSYKNKLYSLPRIIEVDPQRKLKLKLSNGDEVIHRCNINYSRAFIPDVALSVFNLSAGVIFGLSALGVDYLTGHLFDCNDFANNSSEELLDREKSYLVLPFDTQYFSKESYLRKKAYEKLNKNKLKFEKINYGEDYEKNGVYGSYRNAKKRDVIKLLPVAKKYSATSGLTYFSKDQKKFDAYEVSFQSGKVKRNPKLDFVDALSPKRTWKDVIKDSLILLPNSLTVTFPSQPGVQSSELSGDDERTRSADDHPNALPQALRFLGVSSIDHPNRFNNFDYKVSLAPVIGGHSYSLAFNDQHFDWYDFYLNYSLKMTGFTPIGQFSASLGYGAMYSHYKVRELDESFDKVVPNLYLALNYYAFLSPRVYFTWNFESFDLSDVKVREIDRSIKSMYQVSVGFGFTYLEIGDALRSLF